MKGFSVGAELFHAGMTKLIVTYRNFAAAPKNVLTHSVQMYILTLWG